MYGDAGQAERRILLEESHGRRWCAGTGRHRRCGPVVNGRAGAPAGGVSFHFVPGTDAREEPEGSNSIRFRLGDDVEAARSRQGERTKRYADEADDEANEDGAPR